MFDNLDNHGQPGFSPGVEQHQTLLEGGKPFAGLPSTTAQFADQMESGGLKIEETLSRLNCKYQTLFFIAAWGVVFASALSILSSFFHFQMANCVNSLFLLVFGFIMTVLDIPGSPRWAGRYRQMVRKYVRFLTRLTGKSLWFLYLGSMIAVSLWPSGNHKSGALLIFAALCLSLFVVFVAIIGLLIAFRKSLRLERVRKILQSTYKGNSPEAYRKYAITDPAHGMQFEEFNRLAADHTQGKTQFDVVDLGIIYNALDEHQKSAINEREFSEWLAGPMTYM